MEELTELEKAILDFEESHSGRNKEGAILATFDLPSARYHQILNRLIDTPAAVATSPMLLNRLASARARKVHARATRSLAVPPRRDYEAKRG